MRLSFLLRESIGTKEMLAVYCNRRATDKFFVGNLLKCDSYGLTLFLLSQNASPDGIGYFHSKSIFRIEQGSQYLQQINNNAHVDKAVPLQGSPWDSFLTYAEDHWLVLQIRGHSEKQTLFGIPVAHASNHVVIQRIRRNGNPGKVYKIYRSRIALMLCNSSSEKKIQLKLQSKEW